MNLRFFLYFIKVWQFFLLVKVSNKVPQIGLVISVIFAKLVFTTRILNRLTNISIFLQLKMVSLTERVIHLEKQTETYAKKDLVERHDRDVRTMQTSLTQVRAQVVQLERASIEPRSASSDTPDSNFSYIHTLN